MELTRDSALFLIGIPLQVFINRSHKAKRRLAVGDEPTAVTSFPGTDAGKDEKNIEGIDGRAAATSKPAGEDNSSGITSSTHPQEWTETKDGAMDDPDGTFAPDQAHPAAHPPSPNEPAISSSTTSRREPEPLSHLEPLSGAAASSLPASSEAAPAAAHLPGNHPPKPSAPAKTRPQGDRAERSSCACGLLDRCVRKIRSRNRPKRVEIVPEKPWGSELKKPRGQREPRPRFTRSSGSMARPWGLKPPPGIPY